jgi:predicted nucleotidyltransferase
MVRDVPSVLFTPHERERLRAELVSQAERDDRIRAAAHTGSAAVGREDRWSDIDLALCIKDGAEIDGVVADWTSRMHREHGAVAHHDVRRGATLFRVFLLGNTLQVDLAFWSSAEFGAIAPTFRLAFGTANERPFPPPAPPSEFIGMAWLYALHVRSSVCRGRRWQAVYMLSGMRDNVLALACLRHGLPVREARGVDDLPGAVILPFEKTLAPTLSTAAVTSAFAATIAALLDETRLVDAELASRLAGPLNALISECEA